MPPPFHLLGTRVGLVATIALLPVAFGLGIRLANLAMSAYGRRKLLTYDPQARDIGDLGHQAMKSSTEDRDEIDEASDDSFPESDSPRYTSH